MRFDLRHGDSREVLPLLDAASVDALVTDPPAGIGFMGKEWDDFRRSRNEADAGRPDVFGRTSARGPEYARRSREAFIGALGGIFEECLRVLKPGAHGLVWALPRTSHWTATALEDAGFEIRDVGVHLFGTGFPKSLNLGDGRATALKPASEHWILVRRPLDGTVAQNVAAHGTGALNIDACRIGTETITQFQKDMRPLKRGGLIDVERRTQMTGVKTTTIGRWPPNVTLEHDAACGKSCVLRCPVLNIDAQSGDVGAFAPPGGPSETIANVYSGGPGTRSTVYHGDSGGASRFFYVAKPDRGERDIGCEDLPAVSGGAATDRKDGSAGTLNPRAGAGRNGGARNIHPTVKSVDLMRWLCRLVTPKGGLVLDPFMGSGSTGIACAREGMRFIGIERERAYFEIARRRIVGDAPLLNRIGQLQLEGPDKEIA